MLKSNYIALSCFLLLLLTLPIYSHPDKGRRPETGFLNREIQVDNESYRYQIYLPQDWDPAQKWPVILFLHGAGERGDDGLIQTDVGIGRAIRRLIARFPAVVVFPQCKKDLNWDLPVMQRRALIALEQSIQEFNGDTDRLYLTGISLGGYGTWILAATNPGKFAAIVPIAGGVIPPPLIPELPPNPDPDPYAIVARRMGQTPVWIFHGALDPVVPVSEARKMYAALQAAGGNVRYTEYPFALHNSWDRAYAEADLMTWLLNQRKY
jgi:predicted peptidase